MRTAAVNIYKLQGDGFIRRIKKTIIVMLLVFSMTAACVAAIAASSWTDKQNKLHEIAEIARSIGLEEDDPIIERAREIWWEEYYILKGITPQPEPEPEQPKADTYYSDTIRVVVSDEVRSRIEQKLLNYETEICMLAQVVYNEAGGIPGSTHKAAVMWCVLNRVDNGSFGSSIQAVITAPYQFAWYSSTPVTNDFYELGKDVLTRWFLEKEGYEDVGRVLPSDYLFFAGDGRYNYFRRYYESDGHFWDWSLESPY